MRTSMVRDLRHAVPLLKKVTTAKKERGRADAHRRESCCGITWAQALRFSG